jgi:hypothetical protein
MKRVLKWAGVLAALQLSACTYDVVEVNPCDNLPVNRAISYETDIAPIATTTCALPSCHVTGFSRGDFTSYADLKKKADSGILAHKVTSGEMPPPYTKGPKSLTACQIETIAKWISQGAPNN